MRRSRLERPCRAEPPSASRSTPSRSRSPSAMASPRRVEPVRPLLLDARDPSGRHRRHVAARRRRVLGADAVNPAGRPRPDPEVRLVAPVRQIMSRLRGRASPSSRSRTARSRPPRAAGRSPGTARRCRRQTGSTQPAPCDVAAHRHPLVDRQDVARQVLRTERDRLVQGSQPDFDCHAGQPEHEVEAQVVEPSRRAAATAARASSARVAAAQRSGESRRPGSGRRCSGG